MNKIRICIFWIILFSIQSGNSGAADKIISVSKLDWSALKAVSSHWDAIGTDHRQRIRLIVNDAEINRLADFGIEWTTVVDDLEHFFQSQIANRDNLGEYTTYDELTAELLDWATHFPDLIHLESLGQSWDGREIWAVKVSDNPALPEDEPNVLFIGAMHSRELITVEILRYFLTYLTENYPADPIVRDIVDDRQIWLVPMLNPDGHVVVENHHSGSSWGWWRKNTRDNNTNGVFDDWYDGVDLNRNFDFHFGEPPGSSNNPTSNVYHGPSAFSEPETQFIQQLCTEHNFALAINYHSFGDQLMYPWSYADAYTADHELFLAIARVLTADNGYDFGNSWDMLEYLMSGETCDWMYHHHGTLAMTVEVGPDAYNFYPPESEIESIGQINLSANIALAQMADNPYRVFAPQKIVVSPVETEGSTFNLHWTVTDLPESYSVRGYTIQQMDHPATVLDDVETALAGWQSNGFEITDLDAYSDQQSFYSGYGNTISHTLAYDYPLLVVPGDALRFWTQFDLEIHRDYGYVEVSLDGAHFTPISGNITTNDDPFGLNDGNGINGFTNGWMEALFPLSDFAGQSLYIRFRYETDDEDYSPGWFIDDIYPLIDYEHVSDLSDDWSATTFPVSLEMTGEYDFRVCGRSDFGLRGPWSRPQRVHVSTIAVEENSPAGYSGFQVYPNPFQRELNIYFSLAEPGPVTFQIYNLNGQLVTSLADGSVWARGSHTLCWDGRDHRPKPLSAGLYLIRMETSHITHTQRAILLR